MRAIILSFAFILCIGAFADESLSPATAPSKSAPVENPKAARTLGVINQALNADGDINARLVTRLMSSVRHSYSEDVVREESRKAHLNARIQSFVHQLDDVRANRGRLQSYRVGRVISALNVVSKNVMVAAKSPRPAYQLAAVQMAEQNIASLTSADQSQTVRRAAVYALRLARVARILIQIKIRLNRRGQVLRANFAAVRAKILARIEGTNNTTIRVRLQVVLRRIRAASLAVRQIIKPNKAATKVARVQAQINNLQGLIRTLADKASSAPSVHRTIAALQQLQASMVKKLKRVKAPDSPIALKKKVNKLQARLRRYQLRMAAARDSIEKRIIKQAIYDLQVRRAALKASVAVAQRKLQLANMIDSIKAQTGCNAKKAAALAVLAPLLKAIKAQQKQLMVKALPKKACKPKIPIVLPPALCNNTVQIRTDPCSGAKYKLTQNADGTVTKKVIAPATHAIVATPSGKQIRVPVRQVAVTLPNGKKVMVKVWKRQLITPPTAMTPLTLPGGRVVMVPVRTRFFNVQGSPVPVAVPQGVRVVPTKVTTSDGKTVTLRLPQAKGIPTTAKLITLPSGATVSIPQVTSQPAPTGAVVVQRVVTTPSGQRLVSYVVKSPAGAAVPAATPAKKPVVTKINPARVLAQQLAAGTLTSADVARVLDNASAQRAKNRQKLAKQLKATASKAKKAVEQLSRVDVSKLPVAAQQEVSQTRKDVTKLLAVLSIAGKSHGAKTRLLAAKAVMAVQDIRARLKEASPAAKPILEKYLKAATQITGTVRLKAAVETGVQRQATKLKLLAARLKAQLARATDAEHKKALQQQIRLIKKAASRLSKKPAKLSPAARAKVAAIRQAIKDTHAKLLLAETPEAKKKLFKQLRKLRRRRDRIVDKARAKKRQARQRLSAILGEAPKKTKKKVVKASKKAARKLKKMQAKLAKLNSKLDTADSEKAAIIRAQIEYVRRKQAAVRRRLRYYRAKARYQRKLRALYMKLAEASDKTKAKLQKQVRAIESKLVQLRKPLTAHKLPNSAAPAVRQQVAVINRKLDDLQKSLSTVPRVAQKVIFKRIQQLRAERYRVRQAAIRRAKLRSRLRAKKRALKTLIAMLPEGEQRDRLMRKLQYTQLKLSRIGKPKAKPRKYFPPQAREQLKDIAAKTAALQKELVRATPAIRKLIQAEINQLKVQKQKIRKEHLSAAKVKASRNEIAELRQRLIDAPKEEKIKIRAQIGALYRKIDRLQSKRTLRLRAKARRLRAQIALLRSELLHATGDAKAKIQDALDKLSAKRQKILARVRKIHQKRMAQAKKRIARLKARLAEATPAQRQKIYAQIRRLQRKTNRILAARAKSLSKRVTALRARLAQQRELLASIKDPAKRQALIDAIDQTRASLRRAYTRIGEIRRQQVKRLQQRIKNLKLRAKNATGDQKIQLRLMILRLKSKQRQVRRAQLKLLRKRAVGIRATIAKLRMRMALASKEKQEEIKEKIRALQLTAKAVSSKLKKVRKNLKLRPAARSRSQVKRQVRREIHNLNAAIHQLQRNFHHSRTPADRRALIEKIQALQAKRHNLVSSFRPYGYNRRHHSRPSHHPYRPYHPHRRHFYQPRPAVRRKPVGRVVGAGSGIPARRNARTQATIPRRVRRAAPVEGCENYPRLKNVVVDPVVVGGGWFAQAADHYCKAKFGGQFVAKSYVVDQSGRCARHGTIRFTRSHRRGAAVPRYCPGCRWVFKSVRCTIPPPVQRHPHFPYPSIGGRHAFAQSPVASWWQPRPRPQPYRPYHPSSSSLYLPYRPSHPYHPTPQPHPALSAVSSRSWWNAGHPRRR